jgi:TetR/AcrR family transcriptional repressor of nem operon
MAIIDDIAAQLAPDDPRSGRVTALGVFALMVGTVQVSRALSDRRLSDQVLEQGIQNVLALLGTEGSR